MKNILLATFLTAIFASGALGQTQISWLQFTTPDDTSMQLPATYQFDSIWQMGESSKPEFDCYYNQTVQNFELCTDTANNIADTGRWEMYFGFDRDTLTDYNNGIAEAVLSSFHAKFAGIPDSTGILIEASSDSVNWYNLLDPDDIDAYQDIISGGASYKDFMEFPFVECDSISVLDGEYVWAPTNEWGVFGAMISPAWTEAGAGSLHQQHFRLTYISRTTTPHAGVAFQALTVMVAFVVEIGIENEFHQLETNLYPNPVSESITLQLPKSVVYPVDITITDQSGRKVYQQQNVATDFIQIPVEEYTEGVYFIRAIDHSNQLGRGKFIVKH